MNKEIRVYKAQQPTVSVFDENSYFERKLSELVFKAYYALKLPDSNVEVKHSNGKMMFEISDFRTTILRSDVELINEILKDVEVKMVIAEPQFKDKIARNGSCYQALESCTLVCYDTLVNELENLTIVKEYEDKMNDKRAVACNVFRKEL